jgi:hypothetical protein
MPKKSQNTTVPQQAEESLNREERKIISESLLLGDKNFGDKFVYLVSDTLEECKNIATRSSSKGLLGYVKTTMSLISKPKEALGDQLEALRLKSSLLFPLSAKGHRFLLLFIEQVPEIQIQLFKLIDESLVDDQRKKEIKDYFIQSKLKKEFKKYNDLLVQDIGHLMRLKTLNPEQAFLMSKAIEFLEIPTQSKRALVKELRKNTTQRYHQNTDPIFLLYGDLIYGLAEPRANFLMQLPYIDYKDAVTIDAYEPFARDVRTLKDERQREFYYFLNSRWGSIIDHALKQKRNAVQDSPESAAFGNQASKTKCKAGLEFTLQKEDGEIIWFVIDEIDMNTVIHKNYVSPTNPERKSDKNLDNDLTLRVITNSELRFAFRNKERFGDRLRFITKDAASGTFHLTDAPWVSDPNLWAQYVPQSVKNKNKENFLFITDETNDVLQEAKASWIKRFARTNVHEDCLAVLTLGPRAENHQADISKVSQKIVDCVLQQYQGDKKEITRFIIIGSYTQPCADLVKEQLVNSGFTNLSLVNSFVSDIRIDPMGIVERCMNDSRFALRIK